MRELRILSVIALVALTFYTLTKGCQAAEGDMHWLSSMRAMFARFEATKTDCAAVDLCDEVSSWNTLVTSLKGEALETQVSEINTFFNRIRYKKDIVSNGVENYYATPFEIMKAGQADCEDYAFAKYLMLHAVGVPDTKVFAVFIRLRETKEGHVITIVDSGTAFIGLDNFFKHPLSSSEFSRKYQFYFLVTGGIPVSGAALKMQPERYPVSRFLF